MQILSWYEEDEEEKGEEKSLVFCIFSVFALKFSSFTLAEWWWNGLEGGCTIHEEGAKDVEPYMYGD